MIGQRVTFRPQSSPPAPRHTSEQLDSRCPDSFNTRQERLRSIAQIAQSVEQGIENPRVGSSILSLGTTYKLISVSLKLQPEQTPLYQLVEKHYPTLVEQLEFQGKNLPTHVHREFEAYLKCGRLEHGFLRVRCDKCHFVRLVAFSCKKRGFCPSCGAGRNPIPQLRVHVCSVPDNFHQAFPGVGSRQCSGAGCRVLLRGRCPRCRRLQLRALRRLLRNTFQTGESAHYLGARSGLKVVIPGRL